MSVCFDQVMAGDVTIGAAAAAAANGVDDDGVDEEEEDADDDDDDAASDDDDAVPCVLTCITLCGRFALSLKYKCNSLFASQ